MKMSDDQFGLWAGTAINDTSSVVAAAFSYSDQAGRYATIVKLTRTLMIIPITLVLAFARKRGSAKRDGADKKGGPGSFALRRYSLGSSWASSRFPRSHDRDSPVGSYSFLNDVGKFGICTAMVAIGLNTKPNELIGTACARSSSASPAGGPWP
jgi:uncharacterized membrane protein YadS